MADGRLGNSPRLPGMDADPADQLRDALLCLKADPDRFRWLDEVAQAVVELGGGDAVDLLQIKLDEALADYDPGDPAEN